MYSCDLEDTDSTRSTAAGKGLLPHQIRLQLLLARGFQLARLSTNPRVPGLPFWPTATARRRATTCVVAGHTATESRPRDEEREFGPREARVSPLTAEQPRREGRKPQTVREELSAVSPQHVVFR